MVDEREKEIYLGEKLVLLTDNPELNLSASNRLTLNFDSPIVLRDAVGLLQQHSTLKQVVIYHHNLQELWEHFFSLYKVIDAAGCLVMNNAKKLLTIYRYEHWDLPKGKLEKGESLFDAARRETMEETGLNELNVEQELPSTMHLYQQDGKDILKISHWYSARYTGTDQETLIPQTEEGITDVRWMSVAECLEKLPLFYPSLRNLLLRYVIKAL